MRTIYREMDIKTIFDRTAGKVGRHKDHTADQDILSSKSDPVVGYKPEGEPVTKSERITRAKASNEAIKEGRVISIEDLEKESENW